jgi:hypothetical protein
MAAHPLRYPRTSQTRRTPITAEPIPTSRKVASGVSVTCAIARFTEAGNAAKRMPSIAKTKPIATRKSDIPANTHPAPRDRYLGTAGTAGAALAAGAAPAAGADVRALLCIDEFSRVLPDGSTK